MTAPAMPLEKSWQSSRLHWPVESPVAARSGAGHLAPPPSHAARGRGGVQTRIFNWLMDLMSSGELTAIDDSAEGHAVLQEVLDDLAEMPNFQVIEQLDREELVRNLMAELTGWGPLAALLEDPTVSDILVNGPYDIWVDRYGQLERVSLTFEDEPHLRRIMDRMVASHGRHLEEASPYVDVRLPDGSRLHASIPPVSEAPVLAIRRAATYPLRMKDIVSAGSLTPEICQFLEQLIADRRNLLISGGASSGKTTLLNILAARIPEDERLITIEETRELKFDHPHVVPLEARMANTEGMGEIDLRVLVTNALRMRADRIIVGEVRGAEVMNMIQAMNVGHHGSMTTIHANSAMDALRRLETLILLSGADISVRAVRELLGATLDFVIHLSRDARGFRRILEVAEVLKTPDRLEVRPVFQWEESRQGWRDVRKEGD